MIQMKKDLKHRIDQINAGTAPAGYKKTKVGIVPEEWDYKPFEEYASVKSKKYNPITDCADYPCIEMEHLQQKTGTLLGTVSSKLQASIKNLFECGDILYGKLRPYLRKYYLAEFNGVCTTEIWVLKAKKSVSNLFLYYTIQSERFNGLCDTSCIGSKMPRADWDYVSQHLFAVPPLPEQQKIAEILTAQDAVIALMQKQIDLLKQQKNGFLQKMFPAKGCTVPEIRFEGFSGEWEQRKIGELIEDGTILEQSDGNHGELYPRSEEFTSEGIPYIAASSISSDGESIDFNSTKFLPIERARQFRKGVTKAGDVLLAHNATVGPSVMLSMDYDFAILSTSLTLYRLDKEKMSPEFFLQAIRSGYFQNQLEAFMKQTTRSQIPILTQRSLKICHPKDKNEQERIGQALSNLDNIITIHQRKLELEQQKKKALMQLLLTGKVRCIK